MHTHIHTYMHTYTHTHCRGFITLFQVNTVVYVGIMQEYMDVTDINVRLESAHATRYEQHDVFVRICTCRATYAVRMYFACA